MAYSIREEDYSKIDEAVVKVSERFLNGIADLRESGLVKDVGGIGTLDYKYEKVSAFKEANVSMDGKAAELDKLAFQTVSVPIPVINKTFYLSDRELASGNLSTTNVEEATKAVAKTLENALFNGIKASGGSIPGYTNHPNRKNVTLTKKWTDPDTSKIMADITTMLGHMYNNGFGGGIDNFALYVSPDVWGVLTQDYKDTGSDKAFYTRIIEIPDIKLVKPSLSLAGADSKVVLVNLDSETVDLAVAQDFKVIEGKFDTRGRTMDVGIIAAPRVKANSENKCGVVLGSKV